MAMALWEQFQYPGQHHFDWTTPDLHDVNVINESLSYFSHFKSWNFINIRIL